MAAFHFSQRMKKRGSTTNPGSKDRPTATSAALDLIVRQAYRRHSRGRIAREAAASTLGL
jgi:hypothetical protein